MEHARVINPSDVRLYYFGSKDVLQTEDERKHRKRKLEQALALTHTQHQQVSFLIQLPTGEILETQSGLLDYADGFVVIRGGYVVPVRAIVDVAV